MTTWTITRAEAPAGLDDEPGWTLHGEFHAASAAERAIMGHSDEAWAPSELVTMLRADTYERVEIYVATPPGAPQAAEEVLGETTITMPLQEDTENADIDLMVHPDAWGRGVGSALLANAEAVAAEHGRTVLQMYSMHASAAADDDAAALAPTTGTGRLSLADRPTQFALRHGYTLEQVERRSTLTFPIDAAAVAGLRAEAEAVAGDAYRLHAWRGVTPERWVDQFARVRAAMSTDAPTGGMEYGEIDYTPERVRERDRELVEAGRDRVTVVAEHVATGELVALSEIEWLASRSDVAHQETTIVLGPHRGHRLGMLVKTEVLDRLLEALPDVERLHTWNAEENAYMLAINVALGFRPSGASGAWQRKLDS